MPLTQVQPGMLGTPQPYNFKNRIINGAMTIDQRNNGASVTVTADKTFSCDRWMARVSASSKFSMQQDAGGVTPPAGFSDYLGVTSLAATSVGSSDYYAIQGVIEGYNAADFNWGSANAKTITLSFWVRSSLTGTFGGSLTNYNNLQSYIFNYTVSAANTWEQKSITIVGPTTGTWNTTNSGAFNITFSLGVGSTFRSTANSWLSGNFFTTSGETQVVATNGATWYMTGAQLEIGVSATTFDYRSYTTELQLCQRYYAKLGANPNAIGNPGYQAHGAGGNQVTNTSQNIYLGFPQFMRTSPSIGYSGNIGITANGSYVTLSSISAAYTGVNSSLIQTTTPAVGNAGDGAVLLSNADPNAFISLTAEL